jgi:hypothetical protein
MTPTDGVFSSSPPRRYPTTDMRSTSPSRAHANNMHCTHMTVTRLYTKEFRCSSCLRVAPLGWLYRCTQDRELLLEDDMERGVAVSSLERLELFMTTDCRSH